MNRRPLQFAIAFLWLALPYVAIQYWQVWDRLPLHMASHFNAAGEPNGWMSRGMSLEFVLVLMAFLLCVFTTILWAISRIKDTRFGWAFLAFCAVVLGFVAYGNQQVIAYNLQGTPLRVEWQVVIVPAAAILLTIFYLASKRGDALPSGDVLAEETHPGGAWAALFLPALLGPLIAVRTIPNTGVRIAMLLVALIIFAAMAMAWVGFRYRFLR